MTSFTCIIAWLFVVLMVPLMLIICALDTRKQELTGIENMGGLGARLQKYMELHLQLLGGGL